jgi:hypothetical protein
MTGSKKAENTTNKQDLLALKEKKSIIREFGDLMKTAN